jgi:hypothetical protein
MLDGELVLWRRELLDHEQRLPRRIEQPLPGHLWTWFELRAADVDDHCVMNQSAWDDDRLRRWLIERAPPLTWRGIWLCALASAIGLVLGFAEHGGGLWEALALALFIVGGMQALRGAARMAWLRLGGTDRPLRTYLRRRLGE